MENERIKKLPIWAQEIIERQSGNIESLKSTIESEVETNIYTTVCGKKVFLGNSSRVVFIDRYGSEISIGYDGLSNLRISSQGLMAVTPQSSNVVFISNKDF
jgi:hypothetical protein